MKQEATNWEIFVWVLHELGGSVTFVDIEDVFFRCFEVAPNRFSWRTRRDLPDYKKCSKALRDAESRRPALLVKTANAFKRQLTVEGQQWISVHQRNLEGLLGTGRVVQEPKQRPTAPLQIGSFPGGPRRKKGAESARARGSAVEKG